MNKLQQNQKRIYHDRISRPSQKGGFSFVFKKYNPTFA